MSLDSKYLFRGVHARHPALALALQGIVQPALEQSALSARDHNLSGFSGSSPFTSWTHDRELALWYAQRHGPGGLLLRVAVGSPAAGDSWSWNESPDEWFEDEVLLRGVRLGVEVFKA